MNIYQLYYNVSNNNGELKIEIEENGDSKKLSYKEISEIQDKCIKSGFENMSMNRKELSQTLPFLKLNDYKHCLYKVSMKREHQYFYHMLIFDCDKDYFKEIAEQDIEKYTYSSVNEDYVITRQELLDSDIASNNEVLDKFFKFMYHFNYSKIDYRVKCVEILFSMVNYGLKHISCNRISEAINFVNLYGLETIFDKIIMTIDEYEFLDLISCLEEKNVEILFKFLMRAASVSNDDQCINKAYDLLFNSIHYLVADTDKIKVDTILEICNNAKKFNEFSIEKFIVKVAEDIRIKRLVVFLENAGKARQAQFYLCSVLGEFIILEKKQKSKIFWSIYKNSADLKRFIDECLKILINFKSEFISVLRYILQDFDYVANIMDISYELCLSMDNYNIVIYSYSELLSVIDLSTIKKMNAKLMDKRYGGDILIFVYKNRIKNSNNKKQYFANYCISVFDENVEYREKYFSLALEELLITFDNYDFDMEFYESLTKYISERELEKYIGKFLASKLVYKFQDAVEIEIPREEHRSAIEEMNYIKRFYDVEVSPDISEIMHFADLLYEGTISVDRFLSYEKKLEFNGIDKEKYEKVLKVLLKIICPQLSDVVSHVKMMNMLMYNKYFNKYFSVYLSEMNDILICSDELSRTVKNSYKIYLDFVCFVIKSKNLFSEEQYRDILKFIVSNLEKVKLSDFDDFNQYMNSIMGDISKSKEVRKIRREWLKIYKPIIESEKIRSFITKIRKITDFEK